PSNEPGVVQVLDSHDRGRRPPRPHALPSAYEPSLARPPIPRVDSPTNRVNPLTIWLKPAFPGRLVCQFSPGDRVGLLEEAVDVELDRVLAEVHPFGDLGVGGALDDEGQDLLFDPAELRDVPGRLARRGPGGRPAGWRGGPAGPTF